MKKIHFLAIVFIILPFLVKGQSITENYIANTTFQQAYTEAQIVTGGLPEDHQTISISYVDGLGRPIQSVAVRAGGSREDIVSAVSYDDLGRTPKEYLPFPVMGNQGNFDSDPLTTQSNYYTAVYPSQINPYAETRFEQSPLNRPLEQGAPGTSWRVIDTLDTDHTIKFEYSTNHATEVKHFGVDFINGNTDEPSLVYQNLYAANQLYKNITKDENWQPSDGTYGTTAQFTNKLGQLVLKRISVEDPTKGPQDPNYHDTYYVYDDFGNLTYVLSPEASNQIIDPPTGLIVAGVMDAYGYQYKYDSRNRLIEKKIPGKEEEYIVYDLLDRPVLTQDKNLRDDSNKWLFTKYDALGRVLYTGIFTPPVGQTRSQIESNFLTPTYLSEERTTSLVAIGDTNLYYTNFAYPTTGMEVLTVNYYDSYVDYTGVTLPTTVFGQNVTNNLQGLSTVSKVRTLGYNHWTTSLTAYDDKGRVIYADTKNEFLASRDIVKSSLDFTGKAIETETQHFKTNHPVIITKDYFFYDHAGRLLRQQQQIDTSPIQLIAENHYDALGQLISKDVGGETFVSGYTALNLVEVTYDGTITNTNTNGWNNPWSPGLKTKGAIPSQYDGGIQYILPQDNEHIRVGLLKNTSASLDPGYFDYAIYAHYDSQNGVNTLNIVKEGANVTVLTGVSYAAGDAFKVERVGNLIKYYKNNTIIHSHTVVSNEVALVGKVTFAGNGGSIEDLTLFGSSIDKKLQGVDYKYNIRGWLTDINNVDYAGLGLYQDLFNFRINYDALSGNTAGTALYNGNIAQTLWKTPNSSSLVRAYSYAYDDLNRITGATGYKGAGVSNMSLHNFYDVSGIRYDLNGNIKKLDRNGSDVDGNNMYIWDRLSYTYSGNQLTKVDDASNYNDGFIDGNTGVIDDYNYDDNGNMTIDRNKGIDSISYNHLNLPEVITINNIGGYNGTITNVYDATGVKLKSIKQSGTDPAVNTEYAGNYVYSEIESLNGGMQLQFFNHPEGYVIPMVVAGERSDESVMGFNAATGDITYSDYSYVFQYKDHLGNVRVSYSDSDLNGSVNASEIIEESNYYPFGLKQKGYNHNISSNGNSLAQAFKYHGKELNSELGLEWYDFSARNYDPALGRWMNLDPLAELMRRHSPYNFAFDNPIFFQDPDGMMPCPTGDCPDPPNGNSGNQMNRGNSAIPIGDSSNTTSSSGSSGSTATSSSGDNSNCPCLGHRVVRGISSINIMGETPDSERRTSSANGQGGFEFSQDDGGATGDRSLIRDAGDESVTKLEVGDAVAGGTGIAGVGFKKASGGDGKTNATTKNSNTASTINSNMKKVKTVRKGLKVGSKQPGAVNTIAGSLSSSNTSTADTITYSVEGFSTTNPAMRGFVNQDPVGTVMANQAAEQLKSMPDIDSVTVKKKY